MTRNVKTPTVLIGKKFTFEMTLRLFVFARFGSLVFHTVSVRVGSVACALQLSRHAVDHLVIRVTKRHRCFFSYDRMHSLVTGIKPMAALRPFLVHRRWLDSGNVFVLDSLDLGVICFLICFYEFVLWFGYWWWTFLFPQLDLSVAVVSAD